MAQRQKVKIVPLRSFWVEGANAKPGVEVSCDKKDAAYLVGKGMATYATKAPPVKTDDLHHVTAKRGRQ